MITVAKNSLVCGPRLPPLFLTFHLVLVKTESCQYSFADGKHARLRQCGEHNDQQMSENNNIHGYNQRCCTYMVEA